MQPLTLAGAEPAAISEYERRYLVDLLKWAGGNISRAARKAGMDRMRPLE